METNGRFVADSVLDASSWFGNPIALFQRSADSGALISGFFERLAHADGHGDHGNRGVHQISAALQVGSAHQIPVNRSRNYGQRQPRL